MAWAPNKAWGPGIDLRTPWREIFSILEKFFLSEALSLGRSQWRIQEIRGQRDFTSLAKSLKKFNLKVRVLERVLDLT